VETLAHEIFRDVARLFVFLGERRWLPRRWRTAISGLGKSLSVIYRDETRHVAFGVLRLRSLREELSDAEREDFDIAARRWKVRLSETLARLPVSPLLRPWFRPRARTIVRQYLQRCRDVGVRG
jgi:hypothetical protein